MGRTERFSRGVHGRWVNDAPALVTAEWVSPSGRGRTAPSKRAKHASYTRPLERRGAARDKLTGVTAREPRDVGIRLIVLYKYGKALAEIALAAVLAVLAATGELARVRELGLHLREDVASRWSLIAGRWLGALLTARGTRLLEIGLVLDAILTGIEGWSLSRGYAWGPWLVVIATAVPLPLEIREIVRRPSGGRIALTAVNLVIVLYLALLVRRRAAARARGATAL
jgi:uncharacterized membrane protein (DUF2068 family)